MYSSGNAQWVVGPAGIAVPECLKRGIVFVSSVFVCHNQAVKGARGD